MNVTRLRVHVYSHSNRKEQSTQWKKGYWRGRETGRCRNIGTLHTSLQHATNEFCLAPRLAESGAHSMDGLISTDRLMKQPSAQVEHATNDFCIAPRLAESGAHSMGISFSRHFHITAGPKRVWEWSIITQQTTFVWRLVLRNLALTTWTV